MSSPYEPPRTRLEDRGTPSGPRRPTWLAVLLGLGADIGGTYIFVIAIAIMFGVIAGFSGQGQEGYEAMMRSTPVEILLFIVGAGFTVLGGYVSARVANHLEYRHGLYLGAASLASGLLMSAIWGGDIEQALWLTVINIISPIPLGIYGGHLRAQQKRRG